MKLLSPFIWEKLKTFKVFNGFVIIWKAENIDYEQTGWGCEVEYNLMTETSEQRQRQLASAFPVLI